MPRRVSSPASASTTTGVSATTSASAASLVSSPVRVERTSATPSRQPRTDDDGEHRPAGPREAAAERHVGGAVEQALGDDRGRADERDLVAALREVQRGPDPPPVVDVVEDDDPPARDGRAGQHVLDRQHVRAVHPGEPVDGRQRALEARARRPRPGRHDDLVRTRGRHLVRADLVPQADVHAERRQLSLVPGEQVEDLAAARLPAGQPELAAELVAPLGQGHPVAALGRHARRLEARRPATDHEHVAWPRGSASKRSPPHANSRPADGLTRHEIQ